MRTLLILLLAIAWIVLIVSVLLMSPKWWLGMGIGWLSGGSDYGSKKSLEWKLKNVAVAAWVAFLIISLFLPYVARG